MADAGYSNGEQAALREAAGMLPHVPVMRTVNNRGDGTLFGREDFRYEPSPNNLYPNGEPPFAPEPNLKTALFSRECIENARLN